MRAFDIAYAHLTYCKLGDVNGLVSSLGACAGISVQGRPSFPIERFPIPAQSHAACPYCDHVMTATETKLSLFSPAEPSARWKRAALIGGGSLSAVAIAALLVFASYHSEKSEAFYVFSGMFLSVLLAVLLAVAGAFWSRKHEFSASRTKTVHAQAGADDRRRHRRYPVEIEAIMVDASFQYVVDCTIVDNSTGGAHIVLRCADSCADSLPDGLFLYDIWNGAVHKCEVRWRNDDGIGLRFDPDGFPGAEREQAIRKCRSIIASKKNRAGKKFVEA